MKCNYLYSLFFMIILISCNHSPKSDTVSEKSIVQEKKTSEKLVSVVDEIKTPPPSLIRFIPKGFSLLDTASGDLNMDGISDMILVLKPIGEDTSNEWKNRPVLILIADTIAHYRLQARNDNIAYCYRCGGVWGDPFTGIAIKNNYFSIENGISAGKEHWEHILTFKYEKNKANWYLSRDGFESYKLNPDTSGNTEALIKDVEKIKTVKDFGEVPFTEFDIHKDW